MKTKAFEGVKVAEFAWQAAGPMSSRYLSDHGATVVRVESHKRIDTTRGTNPYVTKQPHIDGSMFYGRHNANKYSLSIDLNHPQGLALAWELIKWADIMTETFSPGTMQKWGLDYENVKKVKPDTIYLSSSMQGPGGPHSCYMGFGQNAVNLCGFSEVSGWPDRMPSAPYGAYTDYIAPRFNAAALIAALIYRRKTGKGQWLDQSQLESSIHFFAPPIMDYSINGRIMQRQGNRYPLACPHGVFQCKGDDSWIAIAVFTDAEWRAFRKALGSPEWTRKDEFSTLPKRKNNEDELEPLVTAWTLNYRAEDAENLLQRAGVAANVVERSSDIFRDPQLQHRRYFTRLNHPISGRPAYEPQACFILSKTPREILRPSPCMGEHNGYVLKELLNLTDDEIAEHIIDGSLTTEIPDAFKPNM
jgi:crotonobetainyl-CoA:carnitine CoA-transferase CaiB-like acyl-CoA transferase